MMFLRLRASLVQEFPEVWKPTHGGGRSTPRPCLVQAIARECVERDDPFMTCTHVGNKSIPKIGSKNNEEN